MLKLIHQSLQVINMTTTRIDMRIDDSIKQAAEKAAALKGMKSLTEYVVRLIKEDAERVIHEHEAISLEGDIFDRFMAACDAAEAPNSKLVEAFQYTKNITS